MASLIGHGNATVGRRSREYLTEREVERLIEAAKQNRSGHRDATTILDLALGLIGVTKMKSSPAAMIRATPSTGTGRRRQG
jgi:hypothetical protein